MATPENQMQQQKPAQGTSSKAFLFELGSIVATPAAMAVLNENAVCFLSLLARHVRGDWGRVCPEDAEQNNDAVSLGGRILSVYPVGKTLADVWVITEADRSNTTILLPSDY